MSKLRSVPFTLWLAAMLGVIFGALSALGLRDWVSVLSGTPVPGVPYAAAAIGGALYVLAYFGAVLVAPILAIAGGLSMLLRRAFGDARSRS